MSCGEEESQETGFHEGQSTERSLETGRGICVMEDMQVATAWGDVNVPGDFDGRL